MSFKKKFYAFLDFRMESPVFPFKCGFMATAFVSAFFGQFHFETKPLWALSIGDWLLRLIMPFMALCLAGEALQCADATFFKNITYNNKIVMVVCGVFGWFLFLFLFVVLLWVWLNW